MVHLCTFHLAVLLVADKPKVKKIFLASTHGIDSEEIQLTRRESKGKVYKAIIVFNFLIRTSMTNGDPFYLLLRFSVFI